MDTSILEERLRFVTDRATGHWSMTELCERFGITRPTGYKWVARHRAGGTGGLEDRSRAPHDSPDRTDVTVEAWLLAHAASTAGARTGSCRSSARGIRIAPGRRGAR